jgi:hypothetical protein
MHNIHLITRFACIVTIAFKYNAQGLLCCSIQFIYTNLDTDGVAAATAVADYQ